MSEFIEYFRKDEELENWFATVRQHILDTNSKAIFELPPQFQEKGEQRKVFSFLQEGIGEYSYMDNNILLVDLMTAKAVEAVEFQIGKGTVQMGSYIPYLPLKRNTPGNRSVELSMKDLSRVREDRII